MTVPAFSSHLAFSGPVCSYSLLVELNHLGAFVFIPEWSVLRRNCGSTGSAPESVTIWAFVGMKAVIMIVLVAVSHIVDVASS